MSYLTSNPQLKPFGKPTTHWMVDVETTGLNPAVHAITSIALLQFQPGEIIENFDLHEKVHVRIIDKEWPNEDVSTMHWRKGMGIDEAEALLPGWLKQPLREYIATKVCADPLHTYLWSKSPQFDISFLYYFLYYSSSPLGKLGVPWSYKNIVDVRTLTTCAHFTEKDYEWAEIEADNCHGKTEVYKKHTALYDCVCQVMQVAKVYGI